VDMVDGETGDIGLDGALEILFKQKVVKKQKRNCKIIRDLKPKEKGKIKREKIKVEKL